ncbi:hypothetical protein [Leeuwenhoekiella parthenopeia]|uniref:Lipoprotein n=1 Tax=Leeuwenhoekiella parthenopeia TaxID=2890320 RepID=A0ABS8GP96_9FLAO|nr:hypothetical protein [Leeuwenhoekiella parthenopeia]MCC4211586.1 hypothetical protein [Leeuwenhoekiella parthenopeia]
MRKITFFTAALFAAFLVTSCDKPCDCQELEEPTAGVPGNIIPLQVADSLYKNYGNSRVSLIEMAENITEEGDTIPKEDANYKQATRLVSFSFAEMKKYMAYIEQQADSAGVEITELRVYFGKYGKNPKNKNKSNKGTVFFNPATEFVKADGTRDTVSFAILNKADGSKEAVTVGSVLNGLTSDSGLSEENVTSLSENIGHEMPPPPISSEDF